MLRSVLCLSVLFVGLISVGVAAEEGRVAGKSGQFKLKTKSTQVDLVPKDMAKSLGLSLPIVDELATRIGEARKASDPVAEALLAGELAVLEKVANKKASLTAEALQKEAVELVKLREISQELAAASEIFKAQGDLSSELASLAQQAKMAEDEQKRAYEQGEQSRGIRVLIVNNDTDFHIMVHIHGINHGYVSPHSNNTFYVHPSLHHQNYTHLVAFAHDGGIWREWNGQDVYGPYNEYIWNLLP